jgi:hypothetical protein
MTLTEGFGMLAMGLVAIAIGGAIIFYVINKVTEKDEHETERRF